MRIVFFNYLAEGSDLQRMGKAVRLARDLSQTEAFARLKSVKVGPGLQVRSDQEIVEYLRANVATTCPPVETCKMGHNELAVVDEELRVHGSVAGEQVEWTLAAQPALLLP